MKLIAIRSRKTFHGAKRTCTIPIPTKIRTRNRLLNSTNNATCYTIGCRNSESESPNSSGCHCNACRTKYTTSATESGCGCSSTCCS